VTLEPCNHYGRTPPCTDALIAAGVARVVVGVRDPNPRVTGNGVERLRAAGIEVVEGVDAESCARSIRAWARWVQRESPYVILKAGASLDGRIATRAGHSRWITGPESRRDAHALRAHADAVMIGLRTALADDPALTPRDVPLPEGPLPLRVVLDSTARLPTQSVLARTAREVATLVVHTPDAPGERLDALRSLGVETLAVPRGEGGVDLRETLRALGARGVTEVLVEGGGAVHGALLDAGLADALVLYTAPLILGGNDARPAFGGRGAETLADARRLGGLSAEPLGDDLKLAGEFIDVHRDHHGGR
jgi:diaminohydroxyphosphoribosylaminopyrimidine deaminase/5-amino-6-(5-phosphoribosylamino)uracil reductase